jgi:hypothetical protein
VVKAPDLWWVLALLGNSRISNQQYFAEEKQLMNMRNGLAISIAALCLGNAPAMAQEVPTSNVGSVTNSNFGGVNNSGPQGGSSFGSPGSSGSAGYNSSVLEQARSFQQQLVDAQTGQACTGVRSFLRTPQACPTNEKLIKAKADATAFLESVKNPGPNMLATPQGVAAKSSPTW